MKTPTQPPAAGEAAHTPTPWTLVDDGQQWPYVHAEFVPHGSICTMADFDPELEGDGNRSLARAKADAAFIVEACNNYARLRAENEALRKALEEAEALFGQEATANKRVIAWRKQARAALSPKESP